VVVHNDPTNTQEEKGSEMIELAWFGLAFMAGVVAHRYVIGVIDGAMKWVRR